MRRWAEHFSRTADVLVISDTDAPINGVRVEKLFTAKAGARNLLRVPRMRRLVREFSPDIVHGHYLTVGGLYAALSGAKPRVGSAWGSDVYFGPRRSFTERMIVKYVLRKCDLVFAGTNDMAQETRNLGYRGDIAIFRFGVDAAVFKKKAPHGTGEFRILSIRPCSSIYNPHVVLDAFRSVKPHLGKSYLYMLDFGNSIDTIRAKVDSDQSLKDHVRFVPMRPHGEMVDLYNSADIAVSVPNSDSAAASVLESMACELPVIASDIPSMRDWMDEGANGYLTAIDPARLADKMRKAYSVRAMLPQVGRRAREKVLDERNQGTFESNIRVAEAVYKKLLSA